MGGEWEIKKMKADGEVERSLKGFGAGGWHIRYEVPREVTGMAATLTQSDDD